MFAARFTRMGVLYALVFAAAFIMLIPLAACDATGGVDQPVATPGRPTATVEAVRPRATNPPATATSEVVPEEATSTPEEVEPATATPRPRPTATRRPTATEIPTEEPTEEPTATEVEEFPTSEAGYLNYVAPEGDWSIDYPDNWVVNEEPPNYQFLEPSGEAFTQVTYSSGAAGSTSNEELAQLASTQFESSFDNYEESGQTEQNDGSYRIDFKFYAGDIQWDAQAFVEGRQGSLYMLMLATTERAFEDGTYDDIIDHVISSYVVPH